MKVDLKFLCLFTMIFSLLCSAGCKKEKEVEKLIDIFEPLVAGQFYPDNAESLKNMIDNYFARTPDIKFSDNLLGFIVPHAGYVYSVPVASYAFKNIPKGKYNRVVVVFPSHWAQFRGILALDKDGYKTPLGTVMIDRESVKKLIQTDTTIFWKEGIYRKEHSGEVMLPLLIASLGMDFKVIMLMMGDQTPNMARRLAEILHLTFGESSDVLYIASTDMSHYHDYDTANALDAVALNQIMHLDTDTLVEDLKTGRTELCGYGPTLTLMYLSKMRGGESAKILKHLNSGDTQGNKDKVVGYGAVAFYWK